MTILRLKVDNEVKEWPMSEDERRLFIVSDAHKSLAKILLLVPFGSKRALKYQIKAHEFSSKAWGLFFERNGELRHSRTGFEARTYLNCVVEKIK